MAEHKKIAVRTCGGCYCKFDRRGIFQKLSEAFADSCDFKYLYKLAEDKDFDLVVLINGCDSECAQESETVKNLVIDHTNWDRCTDVFAEEMGL